MMKKVILALFIAATITGAVFYFTRGPKIIGCGSREKPYQKIQAFTLAKELAKNYKGNDKCLVIHHPTNENGKKHLLPILNSIKEGLKGEIKEIRAVPIKAFLNEEEIYEESMVEITAEDFNKVIKANNDCDMVITMVALPFSKEELYNIDIFKMLKDPSKPGSYIKNPKGYYPSFGIYNGYIGNLESFIKEGLIDAMSMWKPSPTIDEQPIPEDAQKAFNKRYLIVTPGNLGEIKTKYPKLFPKSKKKH